MAKSLLSNSNKSISKNSKKALKRRDSIDIEHGMISIYKENLEKYLEKYWCKDAEELEDTLWQSYGVYLKVLE